MKRGFSLLLILLLACLILPVSAQAFRCGNRLVEVGDRRSEVLSSCGAPTWVDSWDEDRLERYFAPPYTTGNKQRAVRVPLYTNVRVTVEEWTYNFGPTQFIRILRFENSKLVDITTGDYGN